MKFQSILFLLLFGGLLTAQTYQVNIITTNAADDTPLGFVNVQIEGTSLNGTTDDQGELRLDIPAGNVNILTSFVGFESKTTPFSVTGVARVVIAMEPGAQQLTTVTVSSNDASDRMERPLMGVERLSIAEIEVLPVALGEVDVFRGLQLLSGVNSAGEASNGLSVRGGTIDQNLVLLDGAPIFTPTHLFGLFSVFTPDAIGSVDLYRANIPSRYGGRVSSVLDVRSRTPSSDKFKMQGGIGLVSSHLSVETPLDKNKKFQLLVAGRGGFNDFVFGLVERLKNTKSQFVDGTLKLRYNANENNIVTLSGFYSKDFYQIDLENRLASIFAEDEWKIGENFTVSAGLRYTLFAQLGAGDQRDYGDSEIRDRDFLVNTTTFGAGETMQTYGGFEPRLGLNYQLSDRVSLKAAYAITRQYLQNIYNATTPLPSSRWKVSDNNIEPQTASLVSGGVYLLPGAGKYQFSVEGYYRNIDNLLEYKPGAEFFLNPTVETDIIQGEGQAYGVEFGVTKKTGKLTGQLNYSYARSRNRVSGPTFATSVNGGEWYNGYFDQPHTLNTNLTLDDGKTNRISLNFVVQSNRPYTVPNGFLRLDGQTVPIFLERNNDRLPTYHRLDFSWTIHNPKMIKRRWVGDWTVTVYNLYGRQNAFNIYYQQRGTGAQNPIFGSSPLGSYQLTIFGAPIASLTYSFKFS